MGSEGGGGGEGTRKQTEISGRGVEINLKRVGCELRGCIK